MKHYKLGTIEHTDVVYQITARLSLSGGDVRTNYSGRGMYGKSCYGIVADSQAMMIRILMEVGLEELPPPELDSMGLGYIIYWPGIEGAESRDSVADSIERDRA